MLTTLSCSGTLAATVDARLNEDLDLIVSWLRDNSLFMNTARTEAMLFGTHTKLSVTTDLSISLAGRHIKRVYEFKYLGVLFDEHIS